MKPAFFWNDKIYKFRQAFVLNDKTDLVLIETLTEESKLYFKKIWSIQIDAPQK